MPGANATAIPAGGEPVIVAAFLARREHTDVFDRSDVHSCLRMARA
jgi:hypothetical protein